MAETKINPSKNFYSLVSRSYHPPTSNYCLIISKGGYAPYFSLIGILKSSINKTILAFLS